MPPRRALPWVGSAVAGGLFLFAVVPATALMVLIGALGPAPTSGAGTCEGPAPATLAAAARGPAGQGGARGGAVTAGDQMANAQLITSIVAGRGLPQQAAVDAIATAQQESQLGQLGMNTAVDHDSLGLFQQRPSAGWGTPAQVKDPTYATNAFLDHLVSMPGWATMPVTTAAQAVQRSAFPSAYARWEGLARTLAARFWPPPLPAPGIPAATPAPTPGAGVAAPSCPGHGGDGMTAPAADVMTGPAGATVLGAADSGRPGPGGPALGRALPGGPVAGDPARSAAVAFALAQLGKPYQWGATGPAAYDCSGLVQAAWRAAGVTVPRTSQAQARFGAPVAGTDVLQPGDLIFIPGADGTPADPGHVGLYIGHGDLVDAPSEGRPVEITPVDRWQSQITGIRRPGTPQPDVPSRR